MKNRSDLFYLIESNNTSISSYKCYTLGFVELNWIDELSLWMSFLVYVTFLCYLDDFF